MRKFAIGIASAAMIAGSLSGAVNANAASTTTPTGPGHSPVISALDCQGSTGDHGCGAGFFWRDGWHGWGCYAC